MLTPSTDLGSHVKALYCGASNNSGAPSLITAGGTGDATAITGETIDRMGYDSAVLEISGLAALAADKTLAIAAEIQESDDGTNWDTAEELYAATTVATGAGDNVSFVKKTDINLRGRKRYVRCNHTPNLSATGTDTALTVATLTLGGAETLPAV